MELVKLSKKGQLSIPRSILRRLGIESETPMLVDITPEGVIELRQAAVFPVETYSDARLKEFRAEDRLTSAENASVQHAVARGRKRA